MDGIDCEITGMGDWWGGDSYDGYRDSFFQLGGGKSQIEGFLRKLSALHRNMKHVHERKMEWEVTGSSYFK